MKNFKNLSKKEKAEYIAMIALYPLFLFFAQLGKVCKLFGTNKRRIAAGALCVAMIFAMLPFTAIPAKAYNESWSDSAASNFSGGGDGTKENPYKIATAAELALFSKIINDRSLPEGFSANASACGILTNDISLNSGNLNDFDGTYTTNWKTWDAIGWKTPYLGSFDGAGHSISGIYIDGESTKNNGIVATQYPDNAALFAKIGSTASLSNITINNSYIHGGSYVGGICGTNNGGSITMCKNFGKIYGQFASGGICGTNNGGSINNCSNSGNITCDTVTGGVCGTNQENGTVQYCNNSGTVKSGKDLAGGVCGGNDRNSTIMDCENRGAVRSTTSICGGVCGKSDGNSLIKRCKNSGLVNGNSFVGGVCGISFNSSIYDCLNNAEVTANSSCVGGVCGEMYSSQISYCYNSSRISGYNQVGGITGYFNYSSLGGMSHCYNTGDIKCTNFFDKTTAAGICGDGGSVITLDECFYLNTTATYGYRSFNDKAGMCEAKTESEMKNFAFIDMLNSEEKHFAFSKTGVYPSLVWEITPWDGGAATEFS